MNIIKIINNKYLVAGFSIFLFISCSKNFIAQNPNDSTSPEQALNTPAALQIALSGTYSQLRSDSLYGRDFPIEGDLMADNTFIEGKNSGRYLGQFQYQFISTDGVVGGDWFAAYEAILDANQIIDDTISGVDAIKSQAYGIRALMYFKLVTMYARPYTDNPSGLGVPLVLHYDPKLLPTRATIQNVYTQIVSDLKTVFGTAPDYSSSVTLSKYAIEGLLARAYFYMGDYTNAKASALGVINSSGFTLVNTAAAYKSFWANPAAKTDHSEVMFEVDADAVNNNGTDDLGSFLYGGYQDVYATPDLVSLYSPNDIRNAVLFSNSTKSGFPATIILKYPNGNNTDKDNIKVIRLSEMYLIASEASLPGDETGAKNYLNQLMSYRDSTFFKAGGYTSTGTQLLNDIVTERRKELAFEGDRYYDLNRLKMDINRSTTNNPASIDPVLTSIPYSDYLRIYPIPQIETQANANIAAQQNPGYK